MPQTLSLSEMNSANPWIEPILYEFYLSRIGLSRKRSRETLAHSVRGLNLVKAINPNALDEAIWNGIDRVKKKLGSVVQSNLIVSEWLCFELSEALKRTIQETNQITPESAQTRNVKSLITKG